MSMSNAGLPEPSVLFCCRATPEYYRRPLFSPREVFCGPDCADAVDEVAGRVVSLKTPAGEFDIGAVIARLPERQRPELIVVKADATRGNFPRNLDRFRGPKVLLVGDTHHFDAPVQALLRYASVESFDLIVFDHTRHHAHFFQEAGFERVFWIPALDYALRQRAIPEAPSRPLTFIGQAGAFHPYRRHVLETVRRAGLPLEILRAAPEQTADLQADSRITLNCSLNGDLNLRIFEALGAGAFLITDALTSESGLDRLFEAGRHLETYRTPAELVERIRHYLAHPAETQRIRAAGQAHLLATQSPAIKLRQFYDLLFHDRVDPALDISPERADEWRGAAPSGREALMRRIEAYEAVQALHRQARRLHLLIDSEDVLALGAAARDLPRVRVLDHAQVEAGEDRLPCSEDGASDEPVLVLPWPEVAETADALLGRFRGDTALVVPRSWRDRTAGASALAPWGFTPEASGSVVFRCTDRFAVAERTIAQRVAETARLRVVRLAEAARTAEEAFRAAGLARAVNDPLTEERLLQRCVGLDRGHAGALAVLARRAAEAGRHADAVVYAGEALRAGAADTDIPPLAAETERVRGDQRVASYRAVFTLPARPAAGPGRRILVVTNLFPPQEFGGYGRKLWEFAASLRRRGHAVHVLCADVPDLARPGVAGTEDLEPLVERSLGLFGHWRNGSAVRDKDDARCLAVVRANEARIAEAVERLGIEACIAGNLDLMTDGFLSALPARGVPVIHCVGNRTPGYPVERMPTSPLYRLGPASGWVDRSVAEAGFAFPRTTVLYPGARVDSFYRPLPPSFDRLRIAFASLFVVYKGPHILINALAILAQQGIDFECVLAGEEADGELLARSRGYCERQGLADRIRFAGFLDRRGMADLLDRSNVLVFPSVFDEPFGISHVEAMAAGVAVVTSGTGGSREIVRDGIDGLVFRSGDHEDLAAKLAGLAADPLRWAGLARAGQARAFAFTIERTVDRIEETVEDLLRR